MAQWVLKANGKVVPRRTVRPLHVDELHSPQEIKKRETFDALIERGDGVLQANHLLSHSLLTLKMNHGKNTMMLMNQLNIFLR